MFREKHLLPQPSDAVSGYRQQCGRKVKAFSVELDLEKGLFDNIICFNVRALKAEYPSPTAAVLAEYCVLLVKVLPQ